MTTQELENSLQDARARYIVVKDMYSEASVQIVQLQNRIAELQKQIGELTNDATPDPEVPTDG